MILMQVRLEIMIQITDISMCTGSSSGCGSEGIDLEILSMAISPAEENVICNTRSRQMYVLTLSAADLGKVY